MPMGEDDRRCRRPGEDHISGLPDELLHIIFARLGSIRAAARTCVLSHRWRRVWEHLPALVLFHHDEPLSTSFMDSVDAVLAAYSAPAVGFLRIKPPKDSRQIPVPAHRVAQWLRFASERVVGRLYLYLPGVDDEENREEELEIPACDRATVIHLSLGLRWRLRLPPTGLFTALSELTIRSAASIEGTELTALVSTQCPCLRVLILFIRLCTFSDVSMRSDSLESLWFEVKNTRNLGVVAPRLERLGVRGMESHMISAPKLAELHWGRQVFDRSRHQYVDVGRHIRLLELGRLPSLPLLQRFDKADKLELDIFVSQDILEYESFLNNTSRLPKCDTLSVSVTWNRHGLLPIMHHLLSRCSTTRKFSVQLYSSFSLMNSCLSACPCRLIKSRSFENVALGSLEELEIRNFASSEQELEFMEILSNCSTTNLKKAAIYASSIFSSLTEEMCEKVCSKFNPNLNVEFYVKSDMMWARFN